MTVEECYQELGGDYKDACKRLRSLRRIERFMIRFLEDHSYDDLCREIEAGNRAEAYRAGHTLKGVCANLSFDRLMESASELTEALCPEAGEISETGALLERVGVDYQITTDVIRKYKSQR